MANTRITIRETWNNFHFNGPFKNKLVYVTDLDRNIPSLINRYVDAGFEIQKLIKETAAAEEGMRAFGSKWSLSNIASHKDRMLATSFLNIKKEVSASQIHHSTSYLPENLFFFECGTTVKEISEFLKRKNKSLKTCGASNGQTIAGAISTGVHGSAIDVGSIQDGVVGLNLIIGPNAEDNIYVERHTSPALNDDFAKSIKARVIRNDDLFNAALVGLGSFGIVHGVVIEAEDLYLLKRYVKKIKKAEALVLSETMDFQNSLFKINEEIEPNGNVIRPYHYKLYINPYNANEDFVTEIIYKKPFRTDYLDPIPLIKTAIFKDLPTWISKFAARFPDAIPLFIEALKSSAFPEIDDNIEGTLGEIFWDTSQVSKAFGCGFGIDNSDCTKALDLFIGLMNSEGPIPGIIAMRFVKASKATLSFTKFPVTCILEVDGIPWQETPQLQSLEKFLTKVVESFNSNNIKFTFHWGKNAPWALPNLAVNMYGNSVQKWIDIRSALLTKEMAKLFSNEFLETAGLDEYNINADSNLAASIL
jgi:FAD binding domain